MRLLPDRALSQGSLFSHRRDSEAFSRPARLRVWLDNGRLNKCLMVFIIGICSVCVLAFAMRSGNVLSFLDAPRPAYSGSSSSLVVAPSTQTVCKESAGALHSFAMLQLPPFSSGACCKRAVLASTDLGGIGHRILAFALALDLANRTDAALVLDPSFFIPGLADRVYPYLRLLTGLDRFVTLLELREESSGAARSFSTPWGRLQLKETATLEEAAHTLASSCDVMVKAETGDGNSCRDSVTGRRDWCLSIGVPGALQRVRSLLRTLYVSGPAPLIGLPFFTTDCSRLRVAWHIRHGDISLHQNEEYWQRLHASVNGALRQADALLLTKDGSEITAASTRDDDADAGIDHYIFSEEPIEAGSGTFSFLYQLPGFRFTNVHGGEAEQILMHLAAADVLVLSGSSLPVVAAALADPEGQVSLFAAPKESQQPRDGPYRMLLLDGQLEIQPDGSLSADDVQALAQRVRALRSPAAAKRRCAAHISEPDQNPFLRSSKL